MILTVNVGNTNTRLLWWSGAAVRARRLVRTRQLLAEPVSLLSGLRRADGAAVASVVPEATGLLATHLGRRVDGRVLVLGPHTKVGLEFRYVRSQLGVDRVCVAVGAWQRRRDNCLVVDFGTAVTVNVVLAEGCFWGGLVMPGVDMMLDSLARGTSLLPRLRLRARPRGFGRTTQTAIAAGVFGLVAAGVRDAIESVERRTGRAFAVVLTGGDARLFCRALGRRVAVDSDLAGRGLAQVYRLNCRGQ